mgnify:CR=1 FL=1
MKSLLKYIKDYKKESILAPLFKMLEASFELMVPLVMASIIDRGIANRDTQQIISGACQRGDGAVFQRKGGCRVCHKAACGAVCAYSEPVLHGAGYHRY